MKSSYTSLPSASRHIRRLLDTHGLRPVDPEFTPERAMEQQARFYMTPVRRGRRVHWFKASLSAAPGLTKSLMHEISMQRAFRDYEKVARPGFDSPSFLAGGGTGDFRWLLRDYWQGDFGGSMTETFGLSSSFVRRVSPERMARAIADIRSMSTFLRPRLSIPVHDAGWYLLDFRYYARHFFRQLLAHRLNPGWQARDVRRWEGALINATKFLQQHARWFSHGDLYPNNMMLVGKRPTIVLFDWELAHWNLPTFDTVMLGLMAWRHPAWQSRFMNYGVRAFADPVGQRAWGIAQLSLATRFAGFAWLRLTNGQPDRYPPLQKKYRPILVQMWHSMVQKLRQADELLSLHS